LCKYLADLYGWSAEHVADMTPQQTAIYTTEEPTGPELTRRQLLAWKAAGKPPLLEWLAGHKK
jgi:hypothetical protein